MYELVSTVILVTFVVLTVLAFSRIGHRFLEYSREHLSPPLLAVRDLAFTGGLAFPFVAILAVRAFGWLELVRDQVWWSLFTGVPAILGIATFVYFEFFVIEKVRDEEVIKYLNSPSALEDREFGEKRRELEAEHVEETLRNGSSTQNQ